MVYYFFEKWREFTGEVEDLKEDIIRSEKVYKEKIVLIKRIVDKLRSNIADHKYIQKLIDFYHDANKCNIYKRILEKLIKILNNPVNIHKRIVEEFIEVVWKLKDNIEEQRKLALPILIEFTNMKFPERFNSIKIRIQELLKTESTYLRVEDKEFRETEETLLLKKSPGNESHKYIPLIEAIEKNFLIEKGRRLFFMDKQIQGLEVVENHIIMKVDHYTSVQYADWIRADHEVKASIGDNYSYFVERGSIHGKKPNEIRRLLGARDAEAKIALRILVHPEQLFVRLQTPVKFAVADFRKENVLDIIEEPKLIAA